MKLRNEPDGQAPAILLRISQWICLRFSLRFVALSIHCNIIILFVALCELSTNCLPDTYSQYMLASARGLRSVDDRLMKYLMGFDDLCVGGGGNTSASASASTKLGAGPCAGATRIVFLNAHIKVVCVPTHEYRSGCFQS